MGYLQGVHIVTFWTWIIFREMRSTDAHSGYVFNSFYLIGRYNLPFHPLRIIGFIYGGPLMHDFHHQVYGRNANFGGYKVHIFVFSNI